MANEQLDPNVPPPPAPQPAGTVPTVTLPAGQPHPGGNNPGQPIGSVPVSPLPTGTIIPPGAAGTAGTVGNTVAPGVAPVGPGPGQTASSSPNPTILDDRLNVTHPTGNPPPGTGSMPVGFDGLNVPGGQAGTASAPSPQQPLPVGSPTNTNVVTGGTLSVPTVEMAAETKARIEGLDDQAIHFALKRAALRKGIPEREYHGELVIPAVQRMELLAQAAGDLGIPIGAVGLTVDHLTTIADLANALTSVRDVGRGETRAERETRLAQERGEEAPKAVLSADLERERDNQKDAIRKAGRTAGMTEDEIQGKLDAFDKDFQQQMEKSRRQDQEILDARRAQKDIPDDQLVGGTRGGEGTNEVPGSERQVLADQLREKIRTSGREAGATEAAINERIDNLNQHVGSMSEAQMSAALANEPVLWTPQETTTK